MTRSLRNLTLSICVVAVLGCAVFAAQRVRVVGAKGEDESLATALKEQVPPVRFLAEHVIFDWPIRLTAADSLNAQGRPIGVPVSLRSIGAGVVIDSTRRALRVDADDPLSVGDLIIGGVFENAGDHTVRVQFSRGHELTLEPGEPFYVGTQERILRPDQIPCAAGSVASSHFPDGGGDFHCWACRCTCSSSGGSVNCTINILTDQNSDCDNMNEVPCECDEDEWGQTSGCTKVLVRCPPAE